MTCRSFLSAAKIYYIFESYYEHDKKIPNQYQSDWIVTVVVHLITTESISVWVHDLEE